MTKQQSESKPWLGILEGIGVAAAVSVLGILLFALIIKTMNLSDTVIPTVNQLIKAASILLGAFRAVKRGARGLPGGLIIGVSYMLLGAGIYILIEGIMPPVPVLLGDLGLGGAVGAAGGVLLANLMKK